MPPGIGYGARPALRSGGGAPGQLRDTSAGGYPRMANNRMRDPNAPTMNWGDPAVQDAMRTQHQLWGRRGMPPSPEQWASGEFGRGPMPQPVRQPMLQPGYNIPPGWGAAVGNSPWSRVPQNRPPGNLMPGRESNAKKQGMQHGGGRRLPPQYGGMERFDRLQTEPLNRWSNPYDPAVMGRFAGLQNMTRGMQDMQDGMGGARQPQMANLMRGMQGMLGAQPPGNSPGGVGAKQA